MERKKLLRQSIVYWLEVSTWEFSFSLDFHFWSNVSCARSADKMHHCYFHNFFFFSFLDKPEKLVCRINTEWVEKASKQTVTNCISGNRAETSLNTFVIFYSRSSSVLGRRKAEGKKRDDTFSFPQNSQFFSLFSGRRLLYYRWLQFIEQWSKYIATKIKESTSQIHASWLGTCLLHLRSHIMQYIDDSFAIRKFRHTQKSMKCQRFSIDRLFVSRLFKNIFVLDIRFWCSWAAQTICLCRFLMKCSLCYMVEIAIEFICISRQLENKWHKKFPHGSS